MTAHPLASALPTTTCRAFPRATIPTAPLTPAHTEAGTVVRAIEHAAARHQVPFPYLLGQAQIESGMNPQARATSSSATGLYQFIDQTWLATLDRHGAAAGLSTAADAITQGSDGRWRVTDPNQRAAIMALRTDPTVAAQMAAAFAADNRATLESTTGRPAADVDLYLAHFLGPSAATRFVRAHADNPDAAAASLFPAAARANRAVFYDASGAPRSLDAIRTRFAAKLDAAAGAPAIAAHAPASSVAPPAAQSADASAGAPTRIVRPTDWMRLVGAMGPAMQPANPEPQA